MNTNNKPTTLEDLIILYDHKKNRDIKMATKITNESSKKVIKRWLNEPLDVFSIEMIEEEILNPIYSTKSIAYTNRIRSYLNKIFRWGVEEQVIIVNPVANIREYKNPDIIKDNMLCYSPNQWRTIYSAYGKMVSDIPGNYPHLVIVSILYYMGMRIGEVLALKVTDIIDDEYIKINKTCTFCIKEYSSKGYIITAPKTKNSYRKIKMPKVLQKIVLDYKQNFYNQRYSEQTAFLFGGSAPIKIQTVRKKFKKITTHAELPVLKLHSLRHSHASFLINRGIMPKVVAERLGNTEGEVIKTYSHLFKNASDSCIDVIDREFYGKRVKK